MLFSASLFRSITFAFMNVARCLSCRTFSVCVCERERECVCVCVCERERECVCVCV